MAALAAIALGVIGSPTYAAEPQSAAAQWIAQEQLTEACGPGGGQLDATGFFEGDLTGDGRADFILSHDGIRCNGGGMSAFCGAQACSLLIYVRWGDLLELETDMLSIGFNVSPGTPVPTIGVTAHGGAASTLRWDGNTFRQP